MKVSRKISSQVLTKALFAIFAIAGLAVLTSCQGVSAGSSTPPPVGQLSMGASALDFGNVMAGTTKTLSVTATNSGSKSLTISSASVSTKYFSLSSPTLPVIIAAGQSANLSIAFAPNAAGSFSATVGLTSDASDSMVNLSLSGTGLADGQLTLNPTSEAFGSVTVGSKKTQTVTLTNTGGTAVDISQASISGTGFQLTGLTTPLTLNASQSTTFTVAFAPQTAGNFTGSLTITSNGSNPTLVMQLSGTGLAAGQLTLNPTSEAFGSVTVGSTKTQTVTLTNTGGTAVAVSQASISGTGFQLSGLATPLTLNASQSTTFTVAFAPQTAGNFTGSVTISSNGSNPALVMQLSGTGTAAAAQLTVSPATLALGSVVVGTSGTASGSLTASGGSVTVTAATTNNSVFSIGGFSLPLTINSGQSVPFTITFSPTTTGSVGASLTVASNAQPSTATETLTGTGTPAPVHTVNLSWNASTSSNISGYNVYRAVYNSSCGSYGKINAVLNTSTLFTDNSVVDGSSYCYATTAVNTSNQESAYSNIVANVQIPAP